MARYYMHTIDRHPAFYVPDEQICFCRIGGCGGAVKQPLAMSLKQIRREQKASTKWRVAKGYKSWDPDSYGYVTVNIPEAQE